TLAEPLIQNSSQAVVVRSAVRKAPPHPAPIWIWRRQCAQDEPPLRAVRIGAHFRGCGIQHQRAPRQMYPASSGVAKFQGPVAGELLLNIETPLIDGRLICVPLVTFRAGFASGS